MILRPPISTLFPYTTLFLSRPAPPPARRAGDRRGPPARHGGCSARPSAAMGRPAPSGSPPRSEEHTSELQSRQYLVCCLLLEKLMFLFSFMTNVSKCQ